MAPSAPIPLKDTPPSKSHMNGLKERERKEREKETAAIT